jgi:SRSO17 transposase
MAGGTAAMSSYRPCPPAPGPLEDYAVQFDSLFNRLSQRQSFPTYLAGLLLPRDRPKTLTAIAGAEPWVQAQSPKVQQLQFFLSDSVWDASALAARTVELLRNEPATAPNNDGVLVLDDTGDRKKGSATDHVGRQYLGSVGKLDNGIVAVTTLWADEQHYYPLHVLPYTPGDRFELGKQDPAFHTKPELAMTLVESALTAGIAFKAIVADAFYGDHIEFTLTLTRRGLPYVLSHSGQKSQGWARAELPHSFKDVAEDTPRRDWHVVTRQFRDGHHERWWATELTLFGYGPNRPVRAICVTTDWRTLPEKATWYLTTNLTCEQASLAEIVRLYGLRIWVEESYKRMKDELGWADFMVRSDRAIRRHWALVCCAFAFCWWHEAYRARVTDANTEMVTTSPVEQPSRRRKKNPAATIATPPSMLAQGATRRASMAGPDTLAHTLLASVLQQAPTKRTLATH